MPTYFKPSITRKNRFEKSKILLRTSINLNLLQSNKLCGNFPYRHNGDSLIWRKNGLYFTWSIFNNFSVICISNGEFFPSILIQANINWPRFPSNYTEQQQSKDFPSNIFMNFPLENWRKNKFLNNHFLYY